MEISLKLNWNGVKLLITGSYEPEEQPSYRVVGYSLGQPGSPADFEIEKVEALGEQGAVEVTTLFSSHGIEALVKAVMEKIAADAEQAQAERAYDAREVW